MELLPWIIFQAQQHTLIFTNHHTWGCPVYLLDEIFQENISGIPKWEPRLRAGIYFGHQPFHVISVAIVLNPENGHVSP